MDHKHYWTFKNIDGSLIKKQESIKNKFTTYQVDEFSALECFDKKLFERDYPSEPDYRDFVINLFLNVIASTENLSPIPCAGSNENQSKKTAKQIKEVVDTLTKSLLLIEKLPPAFKSMSSKKGIEFKNLIDFYKGELAVYEDYMSSKTKNEVLLDRIFIAFDSGFGIKEYDNVTSTPLIYRIVMIFTGLDDLESARKIVNRYQDKLKG